MVEEDQGVMASLGAFSRTYPRALLQIGDERRAAEYTRRDGFAHGYPTAGANYQYLGFGDVGNLLQQTGLGGDEKRFRVEGEDPVRMVLEPSEHRFGKSYPCFWTSGYVEAIARVLTGAPCTVEIVECASSGRDFCVYEIRKVPRRELKKTTHKARTAYSFLTEQGAVDNFATALGEGRPGIAFTPHPTAETRERFGADLECYQIGAGVGPDVISPTSLSEIDTNSSTFLRKSPEAAILITAVPLIKRNIADPNLAAFLHSLADMLESPRSSAVALVTMPQDLLEKFPQIKERFQEFGPTGPPRAYESAPPPRSLLDRAP